MPAQTRSPYLFADPPLPASRSLATAPSHILSARQPNFYGSGTGTLSIKMFLGGAAQYRVGDGGRYTVDDSVYLVLNHGQPYSITIDSPTPVESFCLFFGARMAADAYYALAEGETELLDNPLPNGRHPAFFERTYPHDAILSPHLFALRSTVRALSPGAWPEPIWVAERLQSILTHLLVRHRLAREEVLDFDGVGVRLATREELYRRLYRARDYMTACLAEPLTLEDMASVACLSTNHFLRTFKAAFHCSPHQFLTAQRIATARRLLERTELPVTEICLQVGFSSLGSFSHLFTRRVGLSPVAYRLSPLRSR
jgi:AraC family transcriptional regulator